MNFSISECPRHCRVYFSHEGCVDCRAEKAFQTGEFSYYDTHALYTAAHKALVASTRVHPNNNKAAQPQMCQDQLCSFLHTTDSPCSYNTNAAPATPAKPRSAIIHAPGYYTLNFLPGHIEAVPVSIPPQSSFNWVDLQTVPAYLEGTSMMDVAIVLAANAAPQQQAPIHVPSRQLGSKYGITYPGALSGAAIVSPSSPTGISWGGIPLPWSSTPIENPEDLFGSISRRCECGAESIGVMNHSSWCPKCE